MHRRPNRKVVTAAEMQSIERRWFESGEITLEDLVDRVGRAVADWVLDDLDENASDSTALALVGKGNNGGDALIAGKYLIEAGVQTTAGLILPRTEDDTLLKQFIEAGGKVVNLQGKTGLRKSSNLCDKNDIIIDGVFGFGISRRIEEPISSIFEVARTSGKKVVAIDVPSGSNPDTGEFDPNGLPADACLPVGLTKLGPAVRFGNPEYGSEMTVIDVDIPPDLTRHIKGEVNDIELARALLPDRDSAFHKGDFGRALLVCGSNTYVGAASLAAQACVRSGVGLVSLATPTSAYQALAGDIPESTYVPLEEDVNGVLPGPAFVELQERIPNMDSVLIGVGIGLSYGARELVGRLTSTPHLWDDCTVILDADALTLVSSLTGWWEVFDGHLVITPHPGEMSRLLGISINEVEADRLAAVQTAAERFNCVAVLKGATTLIASPDGRLRINMMPNHGLARGGTGDVLAGLIAGLAAKSNAFDAASLGVSIHSLSAEFARTDLTPYAMTASDLVSHLPMAFRTLAS